MNKPSNSPRRLYSRNGKAFVNFSGKFYGAPSDSALSLDYEVVCVKLPSDGGRARIEVTQRRPHAKTLTEMWRSVEVPRGHGTKHAA